MKKRNWIAAVCGVAVIGIAAAVVNTSSSGTVPNGFHVGQFDLSGMTPDEADKTIENAVAEMENQTVSIVVEGHEVSTTAAELGFSWTNQKEIDDATEKVSSGNLLSRYINQRELKQSKADLQIETEVDESKVAEFVQNECAEFTVAPQDAVITHENGAFQVSQSITGQEVDIDATTNTLNEAIAGGLYEPVCVDATVKKAEPARTTESLSTIQDVLGTFSTGFSSSASRTQNLRNGASKINGTVLMPGEEFSAYKWLTPFTIENGYASAGSYSNGQVVDTVGGGACQICSTLYNAALLAELEITQRQNHSMIVTYVPASQDSAIAGTTKDLKFKNSYDTPIYIEGIVNGGTISFTIYGKETRPENRTIKFVSETLSKKDPGEPIMKVDTSLAPGAQVKVQSAHYGLQSQLWKYVYVDGVETEKTLLNNDTYMASKAIYRTGPAAAAVTAQTPDVAPQTQAQPENPQPAQQETTAPQTETPQPETHQPETQQPETPQGSSGDLTPAQDTPAAE